MDHFSRQNPQSNFYQQLGSFPRVMGPVRKVTIGFSSCSPQICSSKCPVVGAACIRVSPNPTGMMRLEKGKELFAYGDRKFPPKTNG